MIYVDVDDTLVRSVGTKRIPISDVIAHVQSLFADGAILYCWSSGGGDYARQVSKELGIDRCFVAFLPKPNVMIDDQALSDWRRLLWVHPMQCDSETVESYCEAIKAGRPLTT